MTVSKNSELTQFIGRRLRESLGDCMEDLLPVAISRGLDALRTAEASAANVASGFVADVSGENGADPDARRGGS